MPQLTIPVNISLILWSHELVLKYVRKNTIVVKYHYKLANLYNTYSYSVVKHLPPYDTA